MTSAPSTGRRKPGPKPASAAIPGVEKAPEAPDHMSDGAKKEWSRLAPAAVSIGTLTNVDMRAMELLCDALATIAELTEAVRTEGYTLQTGNGGRKGNPLLRSISEQRSQAMKLLASFGLTPLGREAITIKPPVRENPFLALIQKHPRRK
jgi:P27 family predicted phage terminase small subunit